MIRSVVFALFLLGFSAIAADRSGTYEGTYTSSKSEATGKLRIVIQKNSDATWKCQVFFTPEADEIATKPGSCSVENDKLVTEFDAEAGDASFHATIQGSAVDERTFEGTYTTKGSGGEQGDEGKWKASLRP